MRTLILVRLLILTTVWMQCEVARVQFSRIHSLEFVLGFGFGRFESSAGMMEYFGWHWCHRGICR